MDDQVRVTFAVPPDFQPTYDASRHQDPRCLELGIRGLIKQDGTLVADAIALAMLAADDRRLDVYAMMGHVVRWPGLEWKNADATQRYLFIDATNCPVHGAGSHRLRQKREKRQKDLSN